MRALFFIFPHLLLAASVAHAQEHLVEDSDDAHRMEAWLEFSAAQPDWAGPVLLAAGAIELAAGGFAFANQESRTARHLLGWAYLSAGAFAFGDGLFRLTMPEPRKERLARWRLLSLDGITERELGLFEGELQQASEGGRRERILRGVLGSVLFAAGSTVFTAAALGAGREEDREVFYWGGGAMAGLGALTALLAFLVESREETIWEQYSEGFRPTREEDFEVHLDGLGITGSF